jgi:hypothetical protein
VPAGDPFPPRQQEEIRRAIRLARQTSDLDVSVYVGALTADPRATAHRLHAGLPAPASAVLVAVDPTERRVEVLTGADVRMRLDDRSCALATMSMTSAFEVGDLSGGIADGIRVLAEHTRTPREVGRS